MHSKVNEINSKVDLEGIEARIAYLEEVEARIATISRNQKEIEKKGSELDRELASLKKRIETVFANLRELTKSEETLAAIEKRINEISEQGDYALATCEKIGEKLVNIDAFENRIAEVAEKLERVKKLQKETRTR
jgi:chromosome segregation ATPase